MSKQTVLSGIDRIDAYSELFAGKAIGLVTNATGVDRSLRSTIDIFHQKYNLAALYAPEHGVRGNLQAGDVVPSYTDPGTGVPVYSLYGDSKHLTAEILKGVDVLVFDIQDIGSRFYTYLYTLAYVMEGCSKYGLPLVVLDRVNPLGGHCVEGNILHTEFASFVGRYPIPVRYGLTIGEYAHYINDVFLFNCSLKVVELCGWQRHLYFEDTDLIWVSPSPNIPSPQTALLYNGTCLLEGTNVSEGRGTTKPFEMIGSPFIEPDNLAIAMNAQHLPGVLFRPAYFVPSFSKHREAVCGGVQIHIIDKERVQPFELGLKLLDTLYTMYPNDLTFLPPLREGGRCFFDLLAGTDEIRLNAGSASKLLDGYLQEQAAFIKQKSRYHLY